MAGKGGGVGGRIKHRPVKSKSSKPSKTAAEARVEAVVPPDGRPRLIDVAKLAGVSLGSASRALSAPLTVRESTLLRVQEAAERLHYVPDGAARALALRRSMTIGAVLPTVANPIYSNFVQSLQKSLARENYHLLISTHEYDTAEEASIVDRLVQRGIDGIVLIGTDHPDAVFRRIEQARLPCVCAWSVDEARSHTCVGISNRRAMHRVVRHLLDLGHRDFAVISGRTEQNERARARIDGIVDALSLAELSLPKSHIVHTSFSIDAGREAMRQVLALQPRPTAVICCTDTLAAGALAEARRQGVSIPSELSITGFDDIELVSLLEPPLTTLQVRTDEIGRLSGEHILAALKGNAPKAPVEIETRLVVRASTAAASR